jgi:TolA-binding protein
MITPQQIMQMLNSGSNPQQVLQQMLQNNPQMQQTFKQIQNMAGDMDPRDFAIKLAKQNGMTEQQLMNIARQFGIK